MNVWVLIRLAEFFKYVLNSYRVKKIGKRVNNPADTAVKIEAGNMLKKFAENGLDFGTRWAAIVRLKVCASGGEPSPLCGSAEVTR